jgi:hypothetical protein
MLLSIAPVAGSLTVTWPKTAADTLLERTPVLPATAWVPDTHEVISDPGVFRVNMPNPAGDGFFRLRLVE